tara:strand:- start:154 stop:489 length:336 start_codon:yes stop_codon:yes gene_type:complete
MPLFKVITSSKINEKESFLRNCSQLVSKLTKKSEKYVMVCLFDETPMYFDNNNSPSCLIELKSIGSLSPQIMSKEISIFILNQIGIPSSRVYINFEDIESSNWAWNGKTFG